MTAVVQLRRPIVSASHIKAQADRARREAMDLVSDLTAHADELLKRAEEVQSLGDLVPAGIQGAIRSLHHDATSRLETLKAITRRLS